MPNVKPDIAVLICTYNPEERIISRVVEAVSSFSMEEITPECIIIDNNSDYPVIEMESIQRAVKTHDWISVRKQPKQGKLYALLMGLEHITADIIIILDDDNLPESNYLIKALDLMRHYPNVGV